MATQKSFMFLKKIRHKPKSKVQVLSKTYIHGCIQEKEPEEREMFRIVQMMNH